MLLIKDIKRLPLVHQAIDCYRRKLGSAFKYHGYFFNLRHRIDLIDNKRHLKTLTNIKIY